MIDWRQSARGDDHFVRQHEMKNAQTAQLWVDQGASMRFTGHAERVTKSDRARIIALSLSILLLRNGERVGLSDGTLAPRRGGQQVEHLSHRLATDQTQDYAAPETGALMPNGITIPHTGVASLQQMASWRRLRDMALRCTQCLLRPTGALASNRSQPYDRSSHTSPIAASALE